MFKSPRLLVVLGLSLTVSLACGSSSSDSTRVGFIGVPPSFASITPNMGRGNTTTNVTITGSDLTGVIAVFIGGQSITFSVVNDTTIMATIPAGLPGGALQVIPVSQTGQSQATVTFNVTGRDHLMFSEIGNGGGSTNNFEFIEIHNPTGGAIDLTNVYLTDGANTVGGNFYYEIADNPPNDGSWSGFSSDFFCRFPAGLNIGPGQFLTIGIGDQSANGNTAGNDFFFNTYGKNPDLEIRNGADDNDGITDMLNLQNSNGFTNSSIGSGPGLPNDGEAVVLFQWDGVSNLVQDLDYFVFGNATSSSNPEAVSKTGITIGGDTYQNDTALNQQSAHPVSPNLASNGAAPFTYQRIDFFEGTESASGGNGINGHDETSENHATTFVTNMPASPGFDYPAAPRAGETGVSTSVTPTFRFNNNVDPNTTPDSSNVMLSQGANMVPSTISFDSTTNTVTITPSSTLMTSTTYTVTITTAIQPQGGVGLGFFFSDFSYNFTTSP